LAELISKLLEFGCNRYWRMGRRLMCHTGRYGPIGGIVARNCTFGHC